MAKKNMQKAGAEFKSIMVIFRHANNNGEEIKAWINLSTP